MYTLALWGSHPDDQNDDCWDETEFRTLDEARSVFDSADPIQYLVSYCDDNGLCKDSASYARMIADTPFIELVGPDVRQVRQLREIKSKKKLDRNEEWQREIAMQAGMAFGCDGYNDAMGYD